MTRKETEELIQQEVANWQRFGTLIGADKLALVDEEKDALRLGGEALQLLLRSALQVGHNVEYWSSRLSDPEQRALVLTEAAGSEMAAVRQRTALVLGTQDVPEAIPPLLGLALRDPDPSVRAAARKGLVQLVRQREELVTQLLSETERADRSMRRAAQEIWAMLPLRDLPRSLLPQVMVTKARSWIAIVTMLIAEWSERHRFYLLLTIFNVMLLIIVVLLSLRQRLVKQVEFLEVEVTRVVYTQLECQEATCPALVVAIPCGTPTPTPISLRFEGEACEYWEHLDALGDRVFLRNGEFRELGAPIGAKVTLTKIISDAPGGSARNLILDSDMDMSRCALRISKRTLSILGVEPGSTYQFEITVER